jgi:SnoaL-like domain
MSDGQYRQLLDDGWKAYQDERWGDLKNLLHDGIVWHEFHDQVPTGDHRGKTAVMEHFKQCKSTYGNPANRTYHLFEGDHAVVSDEIPKDHDHRCVDIYRVEADLIREMWTCVTHPVENPSGSAA